MGHLNQNKASLQNLKQNQNLFLSLQSNEDKKNRWKYTILVLDSILSRIEINTSCTEYDIDFVNIAESLPKLVISDSSASKNAAKSSESNQANAQSLKFSKSASNGASGHNSMNTQNQRISIQPRICSKLWESLRKSFRDAFKMELEFFDQSRKEIIQDFSTESLHMFK